jgi:Flp pilus assembly pilin Flp
MRTGWTSTRCAAVVEQTAMSRLLSRLLTEDNGQDLIEYALLTAAIGFAGVVGINLIGAAINSTYTSWDTGVNNLWEVPAPQSTP